MIVFCFGSQLNLNAKIVWDGTPDYSYPSVLYPELSHAQILRTFPTDDKIKISYSPKKGVPHKHKIKEYHIIDSYDSASYDPTGIMGGDVFPNFNHYYSPHRIFRDDSCKFSYISESAPQFAIEIDPAHIQSENGKLFLPQSAIKNKIFACLLKTDAIDPLCFTKNISPLSATSLMTEFNKGLLACTLALINTYPSKLYKKDKALYAKFKQSVSFLNEEPTQPDLAFKISCLVLNNLEKAEESSLFQSMLTGLSYYLSTHAFYESYNRALEAKQQTMLAIQGTLELNPMVDMPIDLINFIEEYNLPAPENKLCQPELESKIAKIQVQVDTLFIKENINSHAQKALQELINHFNHLYNHSAELMEQNNNEQIKKGRALHCFINDICNETLQLLNEKKIGLIEIKAYDKNISNIADFAKYKALDEHTHIILKASKYLVLCVLSLGLYALLSRDGLFKTNTRQQVDLTAKVCNTLIHSFTPFKIN